MLWLYGCKAVIEEKLNIRTDTLELEEISATNWTSINVTCPDMKDFRGSYNSKLDGRDPELSDDFKM